MVGTGGSKSSVFRPERGGNASVHFLLLKSQKKVNIRLCDESNFPGTIRL